MRSISLLALLAVIAAAPLPAPAAGLSDDDLLALFLKQRAAFREASTNGLGMTRELKLVTVDTLEVGSDAPTLAAPGTTDAGAVVAATTDAGVAVTAPALSSPGAADSTATADVTAAAAPLAATAANGQTTTLASAKPQVIGVLDKELQVNVHIRFGFDSAALSPDQKPLLAQLCTVMRKSDIGLFQIVGHTDTSGTDAYNQRLSQLRAEEVQRFFVTDCGIAPARLRAVGVGEKILADEKNPKGAENRRVEFQALS